MVFVALLACVLCEGDGAEATAAPEATTATPAAVKVTVPFEPASPPALFQNFRDESWSKKWIVTPLENYTGKWSVQAAKDPVSCDGEKLLVAETATAFHAISTDFDKVIDPTDNFILQFEYRQVTAQECGGAYMKVFGEGFKAGQLTNESKYVIMFGPDKCGGTDKVHFIFNHKNPITGVIEEKHLKNPPTGKRGDANHLYTLITRGKENTYEILIDAESVKSGNLLNDFEPAINPPKEIDDPTDSKPSDWVDDAEIPDPAATKPDDWDEEAPEFVRDPAKLEQPPGWLPDAPQYIPDPDAKKPEDWDDDIHGIWDAPQIANPACSVGCGEYEPPLIRNAAYKGIWKPSKIPNPAYKGPWKAKQIPNPNYFEDKFPGKFSPLHGMGFELWLVTGNQAFTNIYVGQDEAELQAWNDVHFRKKLPDQLKKTKVDNKKVAGGKGAIADFFGGLKQLWIDLYEQQTVVAIVIVVVICLVPTLGVALCCCRPPAPAAPPAVPAPAAAPVAAAPAPDGAAADAAAVEDVAVGVPAAEAEKQAEEEEGEDVPAPPATPGGGMKKTAKKGVDNF